MTRNPKTLPAAMLLALSLQACGGGEDPNAEPPAQGMRGALAQAARGAAESLFAHDGRPTLAARHPPASLAWRTAAGLYASPAQLAWETLTSEPYTVLVEVDQHDSVAAAVAKAIADFRWSNISAHTAHYVRAADPQRAVAAADALTAAGVPLVFLVVEGERS